MKHTLTLSQFALGVTFGAIIACSPTKFSQPGQLPTSSCTAANSCVYTNGYENYSPTFKVGAGKVDILFINDNSASMSSIQTKLAAKFSGFIQNLDSKQIDYRIAITTTDVSKSSNQSSGLIQMGNGSSFITKADASRVNLFNTQIRRQETIDCESTIISFFNTLGTNFQSDPNYAIQYNAKCPSPDTRGIAAGAAILSSNPGSFIREDANLNIILISNDDFMQGKYTAADQAADQGNFLAMMQKKYPTKIWNFNSIIVQDASCKATQTLRNAQNIEVRNQSGPAIAGGIGTEYSNFSNSSMVSIDNQTVARGKVLDICQSEYSSSFATMATQITDAARSLPLNCSPTVAPVVTPSTVAYTWSGDHIVFQHGSEGIQVTVNYRCYNGVQ